MQKKFYEAKIWEKNFFQKIIYISHPALLGMV